MACGTVALACVTCTVAWTALGIPNSRTHLSAAAEKAAKSEPVVEALYRYRSTHGLFPVVIGDLVPTFLSAADAEQWHLDWLPYVWSLSTYANADGHACVIRFTSHEAATPRPRWQWQASRDDGGYLEVPVDIARIEAKWPRAGASATVREFERRVATASSEPYPGLADHYQGEVSYLLDQGLHEEAEAKCIEMRDSGLKPAWAERALALARLSLRDGAMATPELRRWAEGNPSFASFSYLADLYRDMGQNASAIEALRRATQQAAIGDTLTYVEEALFYWTAVMAYDLDEFDLTITICDYWQHFSQAQGNGEASYYVIRAAANVAAGRFDQARADATAADSRRNLWAGDPGPVRQAATAGDQAWRASFPANDLRIAITYN